jgi:hypothetical protein
MFSRKRKRSGEKKLLVRPFLREFARKTILSSYRRKISPVLHRQGTLVTA